MTVHITITCKTLEEAFEQGRNQLKEIQKAIQKGEFQKELAKSDNEIFDVKATFDIIDVTPIENLE